MKKINFKGGGNFEYSAPSIDTLEVSIEKGFADSQVLSDGAASDSEFGENPLGDF